MMNLINEDVVVCGIVPLHSDGLEMRSLCCFCAALICVQAIVNILRLMSFLAPLTLHSRNLNCRKLSSGHSRWQKFGISFSEKLRVRQFSREYRVAQKCKSLSNYQKSAL